MARINHINYTAAGAFIQISNLLLIISNNLKQSLTKESILISEFI